MRVLGMPRATATERADYYLEVVGLVDKRDEYPARLSGGQKQRVAIARALATRPRLLLADEPTGQLDSDTGQQVIALLRDLVHESGSAALVATHDPALVSFADRVLHLRDGRLEDSP